MRQILPLLYCYHLLDINSPHREGRTAGALGSGRDTGCEGYTTIGSRWEGGGAQRKGVDEASDFPEVLGLFDGESDHDSDGDDVLPSLSAFRTS